MKKSLRFQIHDIFASRSKSDGSWTFTMKAGEDMDAMDAGAACAYLGNKVLEVEITEPYETVPAILKSEDPT